MKRFSLLLALLTIALACNTTTEAAGFMDVIRSVEIDVGTNSNPRITAPSSPIQLTDGVMVYTFHDKDVDETPSPGFGIGLKIPLYNDHGNTLGFQWHNSWARDSERLRTVFVGLYASKTLGYITPSVYVGRTQYKHGNRVGPITYAGATRPALSWGLGLKLQVNPYVSINANYLNNTAGSISRHRYDYLGDKFYMTYLNPDYVDPVFTIHANQAFYVGVSIPLSIIPKTPPKEQRHALLLKAALNDNIPEEYRPFAEALAVEIIELWGKRTLADASISWEADTQSLCYLIKMPFEYEAYVVPGPLGHVYMGKSGSGLSIFSNDIHKPLFDIIKTLVHTHSAPPYVKVAAEILVKQKQVNSNNTSPDDLGVVTRYASALFTLSKDRLSYQPYVREQPDF